MVGDSLARATSVMRASAGGRRCGLAGHPCTQLVRAVAPPGWLAGYESLVDIGLARCVRLLPCVQLAAWRSMSVAVYLRFMTDRVAARC